MNRKQRWVLALALAAFVGTLFYVPMNCFLIESGAVTRLRTLYYWAWVGAGMCSGEKDIVLWQIDNFRVAVEWTMILLSAVGLHFLSATPQGKPSHRDLE